jgi:hypothetical protein
MATTKTQSFAGYVEVTSNLSVDTDTLHVDSVSNRVGIGKTNPQYELDIAGPINATEIYVNGTSYSSSPWSSNNTNVYYTSGNIGIGTDTPSDELDVYGNVHISNTSSGITTTLYASQAEEIANSQTISSSHPWVGNFVYADNGAMRISVDTSYLIVGSPFFDGPTNTVGNAGYAAIYKRNGIVWEEQFFQQGEEAGDIFGWAVDISNDGSYAVVSAFYNDNPSVTPSNNRGAIYVFTRSGSTWTQQTKLRMPTVYQLGYSACTNKDGTIVAAVNTDDKIFVWNRNTSDNSWSHTATINPTPTNNSTGYYNNVRLSKDDDTSYLVAGDASAFFGSPDAGLIYVYKRSGTNWTLNTTLSGGTSPYSRNGFSVDISADTSYIVSGAWGVNTTYIYKRTGSDWSSWTQQQALTVPTGDKYGYSISVNSDATQIAVGSVGEQSNDGAFYVHNRTDSVWSSGTRYIWPSLSAHIGRAVYAGGTTTGIYHYGSVRGEVATPSPYVGVLYYGLLKAGTLEVNNTVLADGTALSFTGQHMCFSDESLRPLCEGQIVSANKNKYVSLNGPLTTGLQAIKSSESLPVVSLSNVVNDRTVFGVVDHIENDESVRSQQSGIGIVTQDKELGDNRVVVNSLGEGAIWVVNTNGNLSSGDYITTSNVTGYGQKQNDSDTLHSYTVAKITMDCDFNPQDVPIRVIKKDENGQNILDSYGRLQWEDTDEMEQAYNIRYLTVDGEDTDEANSVWTAAYVGCTYHCG